MGIRPGVHFGDKINFPYQLMMASLPDPKVYDAKWRKLASMSLIQLWWHVPSYISTKVE